MREYEGVVGNLINQIRNGRAHRDEGAQGLKVPAQQLAKSARIAVSDSPGEIGIGGCVRHTFTVYGHDTKECGIFFCRCPKKEIWPATASCRLPRAGQIGIASSRQTGWNRTDMPPPLMKRVMMVLPALAAFLGISAAAEPEPKAPQILIQTKVVEVLLDGAPLPAALAASDKEAGLRAMLTDPEYQTMIRGLSQRRGVDLVSAASVTVKDGQKASVEMLQAVPCKDEEGKPSSRNCGVTVAVLPKLRGADPFELELSPQLVDLAEVSKLKAAVTATMASGHTAVLELNSKTDSQLSLEENAAGEIIHTETRIFTRRRFVFVTAYLIDPVSGKPILPQSKKE